jgi:hypothetical protein
LLSIFFDLEDGGGRFLRNIDRLSRDYIAVHGVLSRIELFSDYYYFMKTITGIAYRCGNTEKFHILILYYVMLTSS